MGLPNIALPTSEVDIAGTKVAIRSLSRAEVMKMASFKDDPDAGETFLLACATGVPEEEAAAWRSATSSLLVDQLVDEVIALSGLRPEAPNT